MWFKREIRVLDLLNDHRLAVGIRPHVNTHDESGLTVSSHNWKSCKSPVRSRPSTWWLTIASISQNAPAFRANVWMPSVVPKLRRQSSAGRCCRCSSTVPERLAPLRPFAPVRSSRPQGCVPRFDSPYPPSVPLASADNLRQQTAKRQHWPSPHAMPTCGIPGSG